MRKYLILIPAIALLSGCASKAVQEQPVTPAKNPTEIRRIKTAAVVGLSSSQPATGLGGIGKTQTVGETSALSWVGDKFASHVSEKAGWKVLTLKEVARNARYRAAYLDVKDIKDNKAMSQAVRTVKLVENGLDFTSLEKMGQAKRDDLMAALGVDALIAVNASMNYAGWQIGGYGTRYPQVNLSYQIFRKGTSDAVWAGMTEGVKADKSVGFTGFVSEDLVEKGIKESSTSAIAKIGI